MILSSDSYLRLPPRILSSKQIIAFDAIRYSIDICEISYCRLVNNLSQLTEKTNYTEYDFPKIFLDVGLVINYSAIFKKVICREFNISSNDPHLKEINKAIELRNTSQHIDERISEILAEGGLPVLGTLSWMKFYPPTNKIIISSIFSGTFTNRNISKDTVIPIIIDKPDQPIQKIQLTGVVRKKPKSEFKETQIILDKIISELKWWVNSFEKQIEEQLKGKNIQERHKTDLMLQQKYCFIRSTDNNVSYNE